MTTTSEIARVREYAQKLGLVYEQTHSSGFGVWGRVRDEKGILFGTQVAPYNELYAMLGAYEIGRTAQLAKAKEAT